MQVLLVTHYYSDHRGGVEIVAAELARRLADRGIDVLWAASTPQMDPPPRGVRLLPMRACNVAERSLGFPYPLWGPLSLLRLLRAVWNCDVVHVHDCLYLGNVVACLAAWLCGKPVVVTQHVGLVPYSNRVLRTTLELANRTLGRLVLGGCTQAVFISQKVRDYFHRRVRFRQTPRLLPNGVDTTRFFPVDNGQRQRLRNEFGWPDDRLVMFFAGRFVEKKGLPTMHRLAQAFPECRWVFAGWGPDDPAGWRLPNVECLGSVDHHSLPDYYRAADLLLLPSVGEGFPLVIQEAMACGCPVLTSDDTAQGMTDIRPVTYVSDLEWEPLVAQVRRIVDSPGELSARRAAVADFAARRWDWERCADEYRRLFAELTGRQRQAAAIRSLNRAPGTSKRKWHPTSAGAAVCCSRQGRLHCPAQAAVPHDGVSQVGGMLRDVVDKNHRAGA